MNVRLTRANNFPDYIFWALDSLGNIRSRGKSVLKMLVAFVLFFNFSLFAANEPPASGTPTDAATGVAVNVSLIWSASIDAGVNFYKLEVSTDNTFPVGPLTTEITGNVLTSGALALNNNTVYYWRVSSSIDGGATYGTPSTVWSFTTVPVAPALTFPAGGMTGIAVNATLTWDASAGANSYRVEVFTDALLTIPAFAAITTAALNSGALSLLYNTTYYWRVSASNDAGVNYGLPSAARSFTTVVAIPAPVMTYPANTLSGVNLLPNFQWTWGGAGAVTYTLDVWTGANPHITKPGLGATSYQWTEADGFLANNLTYNYTITADQGANHATSSGTFKTIPVVSTLLSNPADGLQKVEYTFVQFNWYSVGLLGTNHYCVQVVPTLTPTPTDWATPIPIYNGTAQYVARSLTPNTDYSWRVLVLDPANKVVTVSSTWTFKTSGGAVTPYLSHPIRGAKVANNIPTLYWYTSGVDLSNVVFDVRIYQNDGTTLVGASPYTVSTINFDVPGGLLTGGTRYKWKVSARTLSGPAQSVDSDTSSFVTQGEGTVFQPFPSYPTSLVTIYQTSPTLYWYIAAVTSGVNYTVELSTGTGAGPFVANRFHTSAPRADVFSYDVPVGLTPGQTYYWRVVATNGIVTSTSNEGSFTISSSLGAGAPVAAYPLLPGDVLYTALPTFYWWMNGLTTGIDKFRVAWSHDPVVPGTWLAVPTYSEVTDLTKTSYTMVSPPNTPLIYGLSYYWGISAHIPAVVGFPPIPESWTTWSTGEFSLAGGLGAGVPGLSSPTGGCTITTLTPSLYWWFNGSTLGIVGYHIQYSRTSLFTIADDPIGHLTFEDDIVGASTLAYTVPTNLIPGVTYFWRVKANYGGGNFSDYSTPGSFVVDPGSSLIVPLAGSPTHGVGLTSNSVVLSWVIPTKPTPDMKYEAQYSTSPDMTSSKVLTGLSSPSVNVSGLEGGKNYYWRVRSVNNKGEYSSYSNTGSFSLKAVTAVENTPSVIPTEFALDQNYPNPFNPTTEIRFGLSKDGFTTLKIFNVLGQEIRTLLNDTKQAGTYSLQWDGKDSNGKAVQSGTYIYRLVSGDNVSAKKMIMLK